MTAVAEAVDYSSFTGKKVIVTKNVEVDGQPTAVEIEGTVQTGSAIGLLIKPKGKSGTDLIEAAAIEQVVEVPEAARKLAAKKLAPVKSGTARNHLLERHGATLKEVNEMTEEDAAKLHDGIDHVKDDLGHVHKADEPAAGDSPVENAGAHEAGASE